ncbi:MAG: DUF1523 family protein, partial [Pseudomonadota bacterium]
MIYVKLGFYGLLLALCAAFLHYSLPQNVVVNITGTDVKREDFVAPDGSTQTRDVREIYAATPDGDDRVFQNIDAWAYFKVDSANLTARAQSIAAQENSWAVVTYYGWRVALLSWFPNALSVTAVDGPEHELPIWPNALIVTLIVVALLVIRRLFLIMVQR